MRAAGFELRARRDGELASQEVDTPMGGAAATALRVRVDPSMGHLMAFVLDNSAWNSLGRRISGFMRCQHRIKASMKVNCTTFNRHLYCWRRA